MSNKLKDPYSIVASILKVPVESLNETSSMGEHPGWDSLNHICVIVEIEKEYNISIEDNLIMKYSKMGEIVELYNSLVITKPIIAH